MVISEAAIFHQRLGVARHFHKGVARHMHGLLKAITRAIHHAAMQVFHRAKGNGVDDKVQLAPVLFDIGKHLLHLAGLFHIQRQYQRGVQFFGQRADILFRLGVQVGDGHFGPSSRSTLAQP
jgi:hypothetical protein